MLKKLRILSIVCVILLNFAVAVFYNESYADVLNPTDDQKIEYRATSVKKVNSKYQLRVEIWLHHLTFKGFALRTSYDRDQIKPSNPSSNIEITLSDYFAMTPGNITLVNGFEKFLEVDSWSLEEEDEEGVLDLTYTILGDDERTGTNQYLHTEDPTNNYIQIDGDVQIGYMTFILDDRSVSEDAAQIMIGELSPITGVKLIIDGNDEYDAQELFEFVVVPQKGILRGSVDTTKQTKNTTGKHQAVIRVFKEEEVENLLMSWQGWDWTGLDNNFQKKKTDAFHDQIDANLVEEEKINTDDDGLYEIELDPGTYFVIIDKLGYLDVMYYNITIEAMGVIDLGKKELTPGDINKDGQVQVKDKTLMTQKYGQPVSTGSNDELDFNNDNKITIADKTMVTQNYGKTREIIDMTGKTSP